VVLVHGLGISSRSLVPTALALARDFSVYLPDMPGSGRTEKPRAPFDVAELARALIDWLDAIGLERASFIGTSLGCQVVIELAAHSPRRVERLVLVGPTVDPRWRSMARQLPRWALEATREPFSLLPIIVRDYLRFGPLRFARTARFALDDRPESKLARIEAETLVVRGERDAFVSEAWAERVVRSLPDGRGAVVPGAAHAAYYSAPEELAAIVRPFLRGAGRSARDRHAG
jgi:2-hydroxy-6-oxonona-2,4-dienedioate hydrolase